MDEIAMNELAELRQRIEILERATGLFATDADLDGQYGDPSVRLNPKSWRGPSFIGKRFSQCPPEFLDAMAGYLKYARGNGLDAKRARGWARRKRLGWQSPEGSSSSETSAIDNSGSPFGGSGNASPFESDTRSPFDSSGGSPFDQRSDDDEIPF